MDPKTGLACFGPLSLDPLKRHPNRVRIGFVGTSETVEKAEQWISINARGVPGDEKHPDFPGCATDRGFHSALDFNTDWIEVVTQTELEDLLHIRSRKQRFEDALSLIEQKFQLLDRKTSSRIISSWRSRRGLRIKSSQSTTRKTGSA